jgi:hypothetical protein
MSPSQPGRRSSLMDEPDDDDPILSVVNLIDVFLVVIAALLLAIGHSPMNPFSSEQLTVIKNAGKPDMEILIKDGQTISHYKAGSGQGEGRGIKAGLLYRMGDGGMVYVPE